MALWFHRHKTARAEQKTTEHLQGVTRSSCLGDLDTALLQLSKGKITYIDRVFAKHATVGSNGESSWRKCNFTHYVADSLSSKGDCDIDIHAFRRAFAFLVLHGWDLFGEFQDGGPFEPYYGEYEKTPTNNAQRMAHILFQCLTLSFATTLSVQETCQNSSRLRDVKDTLLFTQPPVYSFASSKRVKNFNKEFDSAANRLLQTNDFRHEINQPLQRADLQVIFRLLMLLRVRDGNWKDGLPRRQTSLQRSSDVQYASLYQSVEGMAEASQYASALVNSEFSASVSWESFSTWCTQNAHSLTLHVQPFFILSFLKLWAALFAPLGPDPGTNRLKPTLPTSISNLFCFANVAYFTSSDLNYRWYSNELQLQQDLQQSTLVASVSTQTNLDELNLLQVLAERRDWFHILLMMCEGMESTAPSANGTLQTLVAFVSPFVNPPSRMEISSKDVTRCVSYVWQTATMQLLPHLASASYGGLEAHVVSNALELQPNGASSEQGTAMTIDLRNKTVNVLGHELWNKNPSLQERAIGQDTERQCVHVAREGSQGSAVTPSMPPVQLRLKELQCYRLPEAASEVLRSDARALPWESWDSIRNS
ncbi:hypothetical protein K431DRAFT_331694 [Polychaeton citri CBS 116435]|uniref:Uncharacterized protein n=1 Tax=Polychaeton citri CBS 116435 TaxID=1314669 RepID=A0A9P4UMT6_9PEZI|nr:hypothetical protein K431DRAFT_331694 [Polychaeton citri CBS 116435]